MTSSSTIDFSNTPGSDRRPERTYHPLDSREPLLTVITPYFNAEDVFWETFRSVQRMSLPYWEWLIVDDGSTSADSLKQLDEAAALDRRIRVIHRANSGPAVARNQAARAARGKYLLVLDSDDMVEPTFAEKAIWFLETQPSAFAAVNSYNVTFGSKELLWPHGFNRGKENVRENFCTIHSVIRAKDYLAIGGFDESIRYGHEDWDFWLTLAEHHLWGFTIPEYLTWYRRSEGTRIDQTVGDVQRNAEFHRFLREKHRGLPRRFPNPVPHAAGLTRPAEHYLTIPVDNRLVKPAGITRVLLIVPWLQVGGADRFNLDMLRELSTRGYEFTVVATLRDSHPWMQKFTELTPDVFCLHNFLNLADHPRFLSYLIESRQVDAVMVSNSEFGYAILPYLHARHPDVAMLDYTHSEEPKAAMGGYPGISVNCGDLITTRVTNTEYLRDWMIKRGANSDSLQVCRCAVDTNVWNPAYYDRATIRGEMGIKQDIPVLLYVGRMSPEKRPLFFGRIVHDLHIKGYMFHAIAIGSGPEFGALRAFVQRHHLNAHLRLLGHLEPEAIRRVMAGSDILLLPSEREGLAIVLMEAMAMGMTPVAADVGGQRELVDEGAGYLIPHSTHELESYVAALATLLDQPQRLRALSTQVRSRVTEGFDMRHLSQGMDAAFRLAQAKVSEQANRQIEPDCKVAAQLAAQVVTGLAPQDARDATWHATQGDRTWSRVRAWRQQVIPIGTRRYATYRRFRQALRDLRVDRSSSSNQSAAVGEK